MEMRAQASLFKRQSTQATELFAGHAPVFHMACAGYRSEIVSHRESRITWILRVQRYAIDRVERIGRALACRIAEDRALLVEHIEDIRRERQFLVSPRGAIRQPEVELKCPRQAAVATGRRRH